MHGENLKLKKFVLVLTGMTSKCSCLEVVRVIEQCRVCSGGEDSRLGAESSNLQLVCLLHFLARYHNSLINLPATQTQRPFPALQGVKN